MHHLVRMTHITGVMHVDARDSRTICCEGVCTLEGSLTGVRTVAASSPTADGGGFTLTVSSLPGGLPGTLSRSPQDLAPSRGVLAAVAGAGELAAGLSLTLPLEAASHGGTSWDDDSQSQHRLAVEEGAACKLCPPLARCCFAAWKGDTGGATRGGDRSPAAPLPPSCSCRLPRGRHSVKARLRAAPVAAAATAMVAACRTVRPLSPDMLLPAVIAAGDPDAQHSCRAWCHAVIVPARLPCAAEISLAGKLAWYLTARKSRNEPSWLTEHSNPRE